jgi:FkbM family methyltransferase
VITLTREGVDVHFDDSDVNRDRPGLVHGALLRGRFYEEKFLEHIRSLDRSGCYVDVGALIGTHTLYFAMLCQAERVHSFEPRPHVFTYLERNVKLNDVGNRVVLHQVALTDRTREVTLTFGGRTDVVPGRRLDDIVREPVAVIKIDVEGMEPAVLDGAARVLRKSKPVVFAEAGTEAEYAAVLKTIGKYGYSPTGVCFNATPTYEFVHVGWRRRMADTPTGVRIRKLIPLRVRRKLRRFLS